MSLLLHKTCYMFQSPSPLVPPAFPAALTPAALLHLAESGRPRLAKYDMMIMTSYTLLNLISYDVAVPVRARSAVSKMWPGTRGFHLSGINGACY